MSDTVAHSPPPVHSLSLGQRLRQLLGGETGGAIVLALSALIGLIWANSPAGGLYKSILYAPVSLSVGSWSLDKSVLHIVNDGLMAVFFLLVGLELKRELLVGALSSVQKATLALAIAVGGMLVPAAIYAAINGSTPGASSGWGVPMATDIAFALGVIMALGSRVPASLRALLMAAAVIDDLGAILVIAIFYSDGVAMGALGAAGAIVALLAVLNKAGVRSSAVWVVLGVLLWYAILKSGIHATVAGVLLAFTIPMSDDAAHDGGGESMLNKFVHALHSPVTWFILPVFALFNTGVELAADSKPGLVSLGVFLGLLLGKPAGAMLASALATRTGLAQLPPDLTQRHVFGMGLCMGIGFTMALFIASLAFEDAALVNQAKVGLLAASLLAAALGAAVLYRAGDGSDTRAASGGE